MHFSQIVNSVGERVADHDPHVIFEVQKDGLPAEESFTVDDVEYRNGLLVLISKD